MPLRGPADEPDLLPEREAAQVHFQDTLREGHLAHRADSCSPAAAVLQEEIFGPVLPIVTYEYFSHTLFLCRTGKFGARG